MPYLTQYAADLKTRFDEAQESLQHLSAGAAEIRSSIMASESVLRVFTGVSLIELPQITLRGGAVRSPSDRPDASKR